MDRPDISAGMVFRSTGPQGHRGRMRDRILAHGGDALADYEIVEMLLFLGTPRGDTKPTAKGLINRFGSLGAVLLTSEDELVAEGGLLPEAALPIRLVEACAERLARPEPKFRPVLGGVGPVEAHLRATGAEGTRVLLLDNRNRLLAETVQPLDGPGDTEAIRAVLRESLAHGATALIVADCVAHLASLERGRAEIAARLKRAGKLLGIVLHDRMLLDPEGLRSYRAEGWLAA